MYDDPGAQEMRTSRSFEAESTFGTIYGSTTPGSETQQIEADASAHTHLLESNANWGQKSIATSEEDVNEDCVSTRSLTNSVWTYQKENGRTYHGYRAGSYHFPNDSPETDRLDFQYAVVNHALEGKLYFAPLENPSHILDIGTGTGTWAIDMGDEFPNAIVEATDLSPIQPSAVPENVQFIIDDAEQEDWAVPPNHYDLIHTRMMLGCFRDFKEIIVQGFKHTKPGGWMESEEAMSTPYCDDGTMPEDYPFMEWTKYVDAAAMRADRPLRIATRLKKWYIEAGFVDVQEKIIKLPLNTWPRDPELKVLGKWWGENMRLGLQGFSMAFFHRELGWNKEQIEVYLVNVRRSMLDRSAHVYHKLYVVWGRKPLEGEVVPPVPAQELPQRSRKDTITEPVPIDNPVPFGPAPKRPKFEEESESSMATPVEPGAAHSELTYTMDDETTNR